MSFQSFFLIGGAGFLGSYFADTLLNHSSSIKVTVYDNLTSGRDWHYQHHLNNPNFTFLKNDIKETDYLKKAMVGHDVVMHFASNPDIARAAKEPAIDFTDGTYLTHKVLEAVRKTKVKRVIYISGSGVYGDTGTKENREEDNSMLPISTYGASKLAGEALISSYCHMFDISACVFRCGNIVGPRQTHGVGYDFVKKLLHNQQELTILGDGQQSKSYIYVEDVVSAVLLANNKLQTRYEAYNVATTDYITVNEIANIVIEIMGIENAVTYHYTGGDRGWKGDIPIVRLDTEKICSLGWSCKKNSAQAIKAATEAMLANIKRGFIL